MLPKESHGKLLYHSWPTTKYCDGQVLTIINTDGHIDDRHDYNLDDINQHLRSAHPDVILSPACSDDGWESSLMSDAASRGHIGAIDLADDAPPQQLPDGGPNAISDHDAVMPDHEDQLDGPPEAPRSSTAPCTRQLEERFRSHEQRHDISSSTSPVANAAVDKLSKINLVDAPDTDQHQVHSPRSSATSQRKRSRTASPSRDTQHSPIGRGSKQNIRYDASRGSAVPASSKPRLRSGLRAAPFSKARKPLVRSSTLPSALSSKTFSNTKQQTPIFVPTFDKLASCNTEATPAWNSQMRAPAHASVNISVPQMMPPPPQYGFGLTNTDLPRYNMVLQPKSSPLTQQQLGAEVKGIYAGLVMVEAKCINMDNARAADPTAEVSKEDWQTLIALHRTLLYEHHDFLMATQHPSANPALRGLASKYCMPARMWKHGIHAFLEVLRHRRPQSQEYMLTFIYLAYQMICLLFDTIPSYLDTWIECLGDLARYRMAIEEDKEVHAVWCSVAARWYQMAADRHPRIGRLYHHLGILERPSLRKLYYYARSLTSVIPFVNAAESLATLCAPILQDDKAIRCGSHSAEAMTICFHARVFTCQSAPTPEDLESIARDCVDAHALLKEQTSGKIASYGLALAVTNIAALFQYGLQHNVFRIMYTEALAREAHEARPTILAQSQQDQDSSVSQLVGLDMTTSQQATYPLESVVTFWSSCFNSLIDSELNQATLRDMMQYVHVNLVWFSSLINLRDRVKDPKQVQLVNDLFDKINWTKLATFLNAISQIDPITQRVEEHAVHNIFLMPDLPAERRPLVEDYMLRGIVWAENYPAPELFFGIEDDDGSRLIETPARLHLRAERVLWLACLIAQPAKKSGLSYDRSTQRFVVTRAGCKMETRCNGNVIKQSVKTDEMSVASPKSTEGLQTSSPSSTTDGYELVNQPLDVRSLSSMEESRMTMSTTTTTPGKSCLSTAAMYASSERLQGGKEVDPIVRIEGDSEMLS